MSDLGRAAQRDLQPLAKGPFPHGAQAVAARSNDRQ